MRELIQLDLHGLDLVYQLVNQLLLVMDYMQHISLTHSWDSGSSFTHLTAKIGSNTLQKIV